MTNARNVNANFNVQRVAEAGLCIALAKILDFIVLFRMPMGGSITLASMAPLFIFAIRWGWKWGMLVGGVYGIVNVFLGGYVVHPLQLILDYPLAFAMCGLAGIPSKTGKRNFSAYLPYLILASIFRLFWHVLSGCIFYSTIDFTQEGASLIDALAPSNLLAGLGYSLAYNASFLAVDLLICLVVLALLWKPLYEIIQPQI